MTRDHQLLVRRDNPCDTRSPTRPTSAETSASSAASSSVTTELGGGAVDPPAASRRVFADPGREHQRVSPPSAAARDPIRGRCDTQQLDRLGGGGLGDARSSRMSVEMPETPRRPDSS